MVRKLKRLHKEILYELYYEGIPLTANEIAESLGIAWATADKYLQEMHPRYVKYRTFGNRRYWFFVRRPRRI